MPCTVFDTRPEEDSYDQVNNFHRMILQVQEVAYQKKVDFLSKEQLDAVHEAREAHRRMRGHPYGYNDATAMLCETVKAFTVSQQDALLYDGRLRACRDLANWWEDHQHQDQIRKEQEARHAEEQRLAPQRAKAKEAAQKAYDEVMNQG